jgi:hypothetical protein
MPVNVERELLLTLTDRQYSELARNLSELRRALGAPSNTAVILEAVRRVARTIERERRGG